MTKSQVSRWISGVNTPTSHNIAAVTELIARRKPGFSLLDWELSLDDLAARVRGAPASEPCPAERPANRLVLDLLPGVAAGARARGGAYEGIWRLTFSAGMGQRPDLFVYGYILVRKASDGLLVYKAGVFDLLIEGWG